MTDDIELKKLYWHSRRGMLELDLLLVPFAERRLPTLSEQARRDYADLLSREDQELYQWLVKKIAAPESTLQRMVNMVLAAD